MNVIRWEPFEAMKFLNPFPSFFGRPRLAAGEYVDWSPRVDISETDDEYLIRAALPAVKKEDVTVTCEGRMLTLSGERRQREEGKGEKLHTIETCSGAFERSFALPDAIDADGIKAESKDGVLTIHVPKLEPRKVATIKIQ
jgi:HSP20 family protein